MNDHLVCLFWTHFNKLDGSAEKKKKTFVSLKSNKGHYLLN